MEFRYGYAELWVDSKRQTPNSQRYSVCNQLCLRSACTSGAVYPSGKKLIPGLCKQGYDWDEHIAKTKVKAGCMAFRAAQNFAHRLFTMSQASQLCCPNSDWDSPFCGRVANCVWHGLVSETCQQGWSDTLQFPSNKITFGSCQANDSTQTRINGSRVGSQAESNTERRTRDENCQICVLDRLHSCPPIHSKWRQSIPHLCRKQVTDPSWWFKAFAMELCWLEREPGRQCK